jgi:hypothetical protein
MDVAEPLDRHVCLMGSRLKLGGASILVQLGCVVRLVWVKLHKLCQFGLGWIRLGSLVGLYILD